MPTGEEMQAVGQQIMVAYDVRVKGLADMRAAVSAQMAGLAKGSSDRRSAVGAELKGLDRAHQAMTREMRAHLAQGERERLGAAKALKGELAKGLSEMRAAVSAQMADLAKDSSDRRAAVGAQLKGLDRAHQVMTREMRAGLDRGEKERLEAAKGLRAHLARDNNHRHMAVGTMLKEFQKEQAGARAGWRGAAAAMQARRGATPAAPPAPTAGAEIAPQFAAGLDRVFEYLANHPDGTRMVELEGWMGVSRLQMSRVLKRLMDEGKVEKRDLMYFAI